MKRALMLLALGGLLLSASGCEPTTEAAEARVALPSFMQVGQTYSFQLQRGSEPVETLRARLAGTSGTEWVELEIREGPDRYQLWIRLQDIRGVIDPPLTR